MLTIKNFSEHNRSKIIGNSLYRICKNHEINKWYIHEIFNNGNRFARNSSYYNKNLEIVINNFNKINKEEEIISLKL